MQVLHLIEHNFYDLHTGVHDWRVTVAWLQNQENVFKNHKQLTQDKHYIAQTSKVGKNKANQS